MPSYPKLSLKQQRDLPVVGKVTPWPSLYEDSTHQLWHCDTVEGEMMLKVCRSKNVDSSTFWRGMCYLFDTQLPIQLGDYKMAYHAIAEQGALIIPDYIASGSANIKSKQPAFILTKMLSGSMVASEKVDNKMVVTLAKHISQLHSAQYDFWGKVVQPGFALTEWSKRLQTTLNRLAKTQVISSTLLEQALEQAKYISPTYAVLIMPDIRWDQFLQNDGVLTTLVDLDAFVYAPRELELVLLEIILDKNQAAIFIKQYQQMHTLPDLSKVRKVYRLLLFLMNVLGETNVDSWINQACWFDEACCCR